MRYGTPGDGSERIPLDEQVAEVGRSCQRDPLPPPAGSVSTPLVSSRAATSTATPSVIIAQLPRGRALSPLRDERHLAFRGRVEETQR